MSNRVVFKYEVPAPGTTGRSFLDVPAGAEFLSAGMQGGDLFVWALVVPEHATAMRRLIVLNTGQECPGFPGEARFIGTVTSPNGIVWHVWDGDAGEDA